MAIRYTGTTRRGVIIDLPLVKIKREHAFVLRARQGSRKPTGHVIQAAEYFRPKLIES